MKITTYKGGDFDNGNGRSYRVIQIKFGKFQIDIILTEFVGTGDGGTRQL